MNRIMESLLLLGAASSFWMISSRLAIALNFGLSESTLYAQSHRNSGLWFVQIAYFCVAVFSAPSLRQNQRTPVS